MRKALLLTGIILMSTIFLPFRNIGLYAQNADMKERYKKADEYYNKYSSLFYYEAKEIHPIGGTRLFCYSTHTPKGNEFLIIDGQKKETRPAFDQEKLAESLSKTIGREINSYRLPFSLINFSKGRDSVFFSCYHIRYECSLENYGLKNLGPERKFDGSDWSKVFQEDSKEKTVSPDGTKEAYISEGNLWVENLKTGEKKKLSEDGSGFEYYSSNIYWSPDSKKIVCCKYRPVEIRKLYLTQSSPEDQLQPRREVFDYQKPGDPLPVRKPVLFYVDENRYVKIDVPEVDSQFNLDEIRWDKSNDFFTFDFNKRGHQEYIVYAFDLPAEKLRKIVDEKSSTFIDYSNLYKNWIEGSNELVWISERNGWRHLYLYDTKTGGLKTQLTKGDWVVKSVVNVDAGKRKIIFIGMGRDRGEDPYLKKYYVLDMDSRRITPLTPENADHNAVFSTDYSCFVDNYSRADAAPTLTVRSSSDGKILYKPSQQADITELLKAGWRMPEIFSAKGRDGKTDIWGIIQRPTDFDPHKKYPIIEYIYAGPQDFYVPKSFGLYNWASTLTEVGFITVIIDGMGTAGRSKAFHDLCWKNLKDAGFPDRIAWIKAAAKIHPEMDTTRVGIFGCSAGGQNAMGALLFHNDFYKVAVAACGCHDNRMDKLWWNEQWMGYPIGKQYEENSNVANAKLLKGKLMLILGEIDNNVDPSSTMQVANQLEKYNKDFELVVITGARHTMGEVYGEHKRRDFFVRNLLGEKVPGWENEQNK